MIIRKAELADLDIVTDIFMKSIDAMNRNHIFQWDEIYPAKIDLEKDILEGQMYVGGMDNIIVSAVTTNHDFDEQYSNGNWNYELENFIVIHRLCVSPAYQNKKIGKDTMLMLEEMLRQANIHTTRLDAFSMNPYALKLYESLGYHNVGEVNFRKGLFYLYEKRL